MNKSEKFNEEIIDLIRDRYPGALRGDIGDTTEAARAIAVALGGMLAFAFRLNGEVIGRTVLQTLIEGIVDNAAQINPKGAEIIRKSLPAKQ